jgi:hypothetical protein
MTSHPYLIAGDSEALVQAMMDGKPVSPELTRLYQRALQETLDELAAEHGIVVEPEPDNIVPFPKRP